MRRLVRSVSALGAVFFAAVGIAACGSGLPGDAVVQVAGTPITKAAFDHWMKIGAATSSGATGQSGAKAVVPEPPHYAACIKHLRSIEAKPAKGQSRQTETQLKSQCETQYNSLKQEILSFLISSQWVINEAQAMKIHVSDKEVQKEFIKLRKREFPKKSDFEKFLKETNLTISDLLLRVKVEQMLVPKIEKQIAAQAKKKGGGETEALKYYEAHKSTYGQPERRNLRLILTKTEAGALAAKKEVEAGKSFASVAKRVSIDPVSKAKGGVLEEVRPGEEEKALDEAVFAAKTGVLKGPVKTPFGYYIFEVTKVLPSSQQPFSKERSTIEQQLTSQREQQALTNFVKKYRKKWTAKTECRAGFVVQDCKNYKEPKVPKTSSTTTPSQTSTGTSSSASSSSSSSTTATGSTSSTVSASSTSKTK